MHLEVLKVQFRKLLVLFFRRVESNTDFQNGRLD